MSHVSRVLSRLKAVISVNSDILARYPKAPAALAGIYAPSDLVIVMATYYDLNTFEGRFRFGLAQRTLLQLRLLMEAGMSYRVVVVDTSPQDIVRTSFAAPGVTVLDGRRAPGIGPQTQAGVFYAYQLAAPRVLKIDPEKYGLADAAVLSAITEYLRADACDVLCVQRDPGNPYAGFNSLPSYQQETERFMSRALAELGLPEDTASGIQAMNRVGMLNWLSFDPAVHGSQWEILWFTLLDALFHGLRVGGLPLPFVHPVEMVLFEEGHFERDPQLAAEAVTFWRNKRDYQRDLIVPKVTAYAAALGITPQSDPARRWLV